METIEERLSPYRTPSREEVKDAGDLLADGVSKLVKHWPLMMVEIAVLLKDDASRDLFLQFAAQEANDLLALVEQYYLTFLQLKSDTN